MEQIRTGASLAIAACIVFGVAQAVRAQGVDHSIGKYLSEPVAQGKAPAMWAAIVNENGIEAIAAAGVRKRGSPAKATIDDQIHIGSLTKAMTSVLLARLVADGVFTNGWRTTIAEVFPELERKMHASYREVTLDELVRHRSGLAHSATNWWAYRDRDIKKRRYRQLKANLRNRPAGIRGDFLYSNLGYMVAGAMAERVTGQSWEELMRKHLFGPLGMNRSGFGVPGTRDEVDEPWGHRRGKTGRWKGAQIDNEASLGPAGTVHLTLGDYAKFARLWFENADPEILNREQLEELATPHEGKYAAGWFAVSRSWGNGNVLNHAGSNTYWHVVVWLAPNTGKAYIAGANASNDETPDILDAIIWKLINHPPYLEPFPDGMEEAAQPQAPQATAARAVPTQVTAPTPSPSPAFVEEALGLTRAQRVLVQRGLTMLGFDVGAADGIFGARTRAGIGKWQSSRGEAATGYLDAGATGMLFKASDATSHAPQRIVGREVVEPPAEAPTSEQRAAERELRVSPTMAQNHSTTYHPSRVMYATQRLDMRARPGMSHETVGFLKAGEEVRVKAKIGMWFKLAPRAGQRESFVPARGLTEARHTESSDTSETMAAPSAATAQVTGEQRAAERELRASPPMAQNHSTTYHPSRVMYATQRLDMRARPGMSHETVGFLKAGEEVRVKAKIGMWFKLAPRAGQRESFVRARGLTESRPTEATDTSGTMAAPSAATAQVTAEKLAQEREFWSSVKTSKDPTDIRAYLERFPDGMFAAYARNRLKHLEEAAQRQASRSTVSPAGVMQTGQFVSGMASYDRIIGQLMRDHDIPGAAVAVVNHGRLVYARGFGMADREAGVPVQPDSLFRIASVSKPVTAVTVLKLVEDGRLDLDARVFRDLLAHIEPHPPSDRRMNRITVRDLLRHSGGFDRDRSGDPPYMQRKIARKLRKSTPLDCVDLIAYMKGRRLDFSPGKRYAYSNFGYCALGRVIEQVSGMPYEDFVRRTVLRPAGAMRMQIASPFLRGRLENEVKYYDYPRANKTKSLDPRVRAREPWPYAGHLATMDANGGWTGSAIDLLRFLVSVDGRNNDDIVSRETIDLMISRPPYEKNAEWWYGLGWSVRDIGGGSLNWWHGGSMHGTMSALVRMDNGYSWVVLMNSRPKNGDALLGAVYRKMWDAFTQVTRWPRHDLFRQFQ